MPAMMQDAPTLPEQIQVLDEPQPPARRSTSTPPAPPAMRPSLRPWGLLALAKIALLAIILYFVGTAMARQFKEIPWQQVQFRPVWLVLSLATISLATFASTIGFSLLFARSGCAPGLSAVCAAAWLSSLGKYVPGKFAAFAGSTYLLNRSRVPAGIAAGVWLLLQVVTVLAALLVAMPLCLWGPLPQRYPLAPLYLGVGLVLCAAVLHPRVLAAGLNRVSPRLKRHPLTFLPSPSQYLPPIGCCAIGWALLGAATWMAARSVFPAPAESAVTFAAAMALATVAGLLAIVPAGLGVREAVLMVTLTPLAGPYTAMVAVLMRLLVTVAELVMAGVGMFLLRQTADSVHRGTTLRLSTS